MKTQIQPTTRKKLLQVFLLAIGICFINSAWAFKASFTYTLGSSGQITCTSTSTGTTGNTVYYWYPGDGSNGSNGKGLTTFNYTYGYNGSYNVVLYINDTTTNQFDSTSAIGTISYCNLQSSCRHRFYNRCRWIGKFLALPLRVLAQVQLINGGLVTEVLQRVQTHQILM